MAYTKLTDFAVKDALLTGNPAKVVRGTEIDAELNAIAAADALNLSAASIVAATSKPTPIDADLLPLVDSAASNVLKKLTWANLKATLLTWLQGTVLPSPGPIGSVTPSTGAFTALSSTTNTEVGLSLAVSSGTDAKLQQWTNAGGTYTIGVDRNAGGYFGSAYAFGINAPTGKSIRHLINSSVITETTSTGLSVTGVLSASGDVTLSSGVLKTDTTDGSDSKYIAVSGGGALSASRGAYLVVYGNENASGGNNGDLQLSSGNAAGSAVKIAAGSGNVATISSTGLAVTGALSATGDITTSSNVTFSGVGAVTQAAQNAYTRVIGGTTANVDPTVTLYGSTHANAGLATYDAATHRFRSATGTEYARIDASGNLGLGVTPSAIFKDAGPALQINNATIQQLAGFDQTAYSTNAYQSSTGVMKYIGTASAVRYRQVAGQHIFDTAPSGTAGNAISFTQAMTLDASGKLLLSNTGGGLANSNSASIQPVDGYGITNHANGTATATAYQYFGYNGAAIGSITQSGTTAVLYNTTSDARLKTNITPAADAAGLIDAIQVRAFDWLSDGSHQRYGFVAQELYEVAPEAVSKPQDPSEMMAVDYSKLVPMLVKEIQSLRARVAQLEGI